MKGTYDEFGILCICELYSKMAIIKKGNGFLSLIYIEICNSRMSIFESLCKASYP